MAKLRIKIEQRAESAGTPNAWLVSCSIQAITTDAGVPIGSAAPANFTVSGLSAAQAGTFSVGAVLDCQIP